jgi:hypothetical protein
MRVKVQNKNQMDCVFSAIILIQILIQNCGSPTFVYDPQAAFSPALQNFDQYQYFIIKKLS